MVDDIKALLRELGLNVIDTEDVTPNLCGICECGNWDHDHARIKGQWTECMAINLRTGQSCKCPGYRRWMGGDKCAELK